MIKEHSISPEEFDQIEKYLLDQMDPGESGEFRSRIDSDTILREKVNQVRLLVLGIREANLVESLNQYHKKESPVISLANSQHKKKQTTGLRWLVAASVILLAGISVVWLMSRPSDSEKLFADFYQKDPGLITTMSGEEDFNFSNAMIAYKTGEYAEAIRLWQPLLTENPSNDSLNYFIGASYLALDKADSAYSYFIKVIMKEKSAFYSEACWYTGLSLIKMEKENEAIAILEKSDRKEKTDLIKRLKK